ncbi:MULTISPECIES: hypothetical protein [unclassified Bradyrhizobium]|uniref:hypothetical protein n=1 Tax=Bradyrhizobium sp. USDA 4541 TaxID=2817704 RepID=UPI0020A3F4EB|nr:hypothetical protein [Bradyrhizobium sp. USDA 4541]MCP1852732.1 hypothetical protein [Bradyrhizobium sp. USDA 4541]
MLKQWEERRWIGPIKLVSDLVNDLLTLDQNLPVYGAYFIDQTDDRCRARGLSLSLEHVVNDRIKLDASIPHSLVIWSSPDGREQGHLAQMVPLRQALVELRGAFVRAWGFEPGPENPIYGPVLRRVDAALAENPGPFFECPSCGKDCADEDEPHTPGCDRSDPIEDIERIVLVDVLDLKKPERAGHHLRHLARTAACKIMDLPSVRAPGATAEKRTPGARWRAEGKPDPHGDRYDCDRAQLAGGDLTDDEVANAVFLDPGINNLTIAKDRIRWLSRQLEKATAPYVPVWDANDNRRYEPVETRAKEIYDGFVYDGVGSKPKWTPHGNGIKQDDARDIARRELRAAGHVPAAR